MHYQTLHLARHPEKAAATTNKLRARDRPLANDFLSDDDFHRLLDAWFGNFARVLLPGRSFYIWGGYAKGWAWTGVTDKDTLWHWMQILMVPIAFACLPVVLRKHNVMRRSRKMCRKSRRLFSSTTARSIRICLTLIPRRKPN